MEFCELNKEQRESFALFVKPRTFFNLSIKVLIKIFLSVNKCTLEIFLKMFCEFQKENEKIIIYLKCFFTQLFKIQKYNCRIFQKNCVIHCTFFSGDLNYSIKQFKE